MHYLCKILLAPFKLSSPGVCRLVHLIIFGVQVMSGLCKARVNLSAYFQKIFGAGKELIWLLVYILVQKEALKQ